MKKMIDMLFLARPVLLVPVFVFIVLGYLGEKRLPIRLSLDYPLLYHLFFYSLILFSVHITNNINDAEADRANHGPGFIDCSEIPSKWLYTASLICICIGLTGAVLWGDRWIVLIYLLTIILGYFYNFRPFYFTGRPFLDFLSNATEYGILCYLLGKRLSSNPEPHMVHLFAYYCLMSAGAIASTTPDVAGDEKYGKITTAVCLGTKNALILGLVFLLAALVFGIAGNNLVVIVSAGLSITVFAGSILFDRREKFLAYTYQIGGGILILLVHIFYPVLFGISLFLIGVTMVYFKLRHHTTYPNIGF